MRIACPSISVNPGAFFRGSLRAVNSELWWTRTYDNGERTQSTTEHYQSRTNVCVKYSGDHPRSCVPPSSEGPLRPPLER